MQKCNCLIVEDEPLASELLEEYISQVPYLGLVARCSDAIYALEKLKSEKIDLIFLDIHLPKLKGLDFLKDLINPPQVIIVSAYPEYALQGYALNVVDYLLKPVEFSRFLMATQKLKLLSEMPVSPNDNLAIREKPHLFFNVSKKKVKVFLDEILYIESLKEYIRITTKNKSILTKMPLGEVEDLLIQHHFIRVHRSFIVPLEKIEAFSATEVEISGKQIPIGRGYKDQLLQALK